MLCSKLLRPSGRESRSAHRLDEAFDWISIRYQRALAGMLRVPWVAVVVALAAGLGAYGLLQIIPQEYAPAEDQGSFIAMVQAPEGVGFDHLVLQAEKIEQVMQPYFDSGVIQRGIVSMPGFGGQAGFVSVTLKPWGQTSISTQELMTRLNREWESIPDVRLMAFMRSGISRGGGGQPVQLVLGGPTYDELARWRDIILARAAENPGLTRLDSDLKETQPQVLVRIDKDRAASLGVSVRDIGQTLQTLMSERQVTTYVVDGEEYDVVLQAKQDQRGSYDDLRNVFVRSQRTGALIPLSNLTRLEDSAGPGVLNRYNRLRAVTITANLAPDYTLGQALTYLEELVREELPATAQIDYKGESLEYKEASGSLYFTFAIALLVVFLVLAAQFESFVHPMVIMMTVPLAIAGGLLGLSIADKTLNIYSQIGIVILIGIAAKNGVLIVEFINQLRDEGREFTEAILEAARIRFRPVVMTTVSTLMGSVPLMLATGPGAESRTALGVVTFAGVSIATVFTLFIVPAFYLLLARRTSSPNALAQKLEVLQTQAAAAP
jgi:multidrug efflux pump